MAFKDFFENLDEERLERTIQKNLKESVMKPIGNAEADRLINLHRELVTDENPNLGYREKGDTVVHGVNYFKDGKVVPAIAYYDVLGETYNEEHHYYATQFGVVEQRLYASGKHCNIGYNVFIRDTEGNIKCYNVDVKKEFENGQKQTNYVYRDVITGETGSINQDEILTKDGEKKIYSMGLGFGFDEVGSLRETLSQAINLGFDVKTEADHAKIHDSNMARIERARERAGKEMGDE